MKLSKKAWICNSDMAAGLPCKAKGRTIKMLVDLKLIYRTKHGWYMQTNLGRNVAAGK